LSNEINLTIKFLRYRIRYVDKNFNLVKRNKEIENKPIYFVLECFRNPYEVDFFRSRYSEFYLISLFADNLVREKRTKNFSKDRDDRDKGIEKEPFELHKLDVNSCVLQSDITINNNGITKNELFKKFFRCICLIRNPGCVPPNDDELFMHLAYSLSLKSTCISRKVGAVIIGPKGYIYGAGWNDVSEGQIGCGLRTKNDYLKIKSIPKLPHKFSTKIFDENISNYNGEYICYKDIMSKTEITQKMKNPHIKEKNDSQSLMPVNIKRLEYCRALHAEENALLQLAKIGGNSIIDGTIYTTTYPCELCAKKIYQTGIRTIYYTEPYPETISEEVFLEDGSQKIEAIQFEGVKSHGFYKLFKPLYDKKELPYIKV
jgi:deoxycytidylate deaminase